MRAILFAVGWILAFFGGAALVMVLLAGGEFWVPLITLVVGVLLLLWRRQLTSHDQAKGTGTD